MNQRTRYFLIGSALVVVTGLCTGVVAYYAGGLPMSRPAGAAELSYLPADAAAIAYADVQDIMKAGFSQRLREMFPTGGDKDRMEAQLGIDLERDIDSVMAAFNSAQPDQSLVILRGRFDMVRIEALATQHGGSVSDYQGKRLIAAPPPTPAQDASAGPTGSGMGTSGAVFLEPTLLAVGQLSSLRRAIDTSISHNDVTTNAALMALLPDARQSGNAWVVGRFDMLTSAPGMPDVVRTQLPAVQWFSVSADVDQTVRGTIRAETADDQAAVQLRSVLNGAISAARMMGGSDPALLAALNSMQAAGTGNDVQVSFTLTAEMLDHMHDGPAGMFGKSSPFAAPPGAPVPRRDPPTPAIQK